MDRRSKKIFSVLFAILIGAGIIFFAWRGGNISYTSDAQKNESGDWKNTLGVIPEDSPLLKTTNSGFGEWDRAGASTTADIVAHELLFDYALTQKNMATTTMSDAEAQVIAQNLVSKIELKKAKQYTRGDLNLSSDNSVPATAQYVDSVSGLTQAFASSQAKNDIAVVFTVPNATNAAGRLSAISRDIARYEKIISGLVALKTPSLLATPHLHLVQKYANLKANIEPMAEIFTDPLKGLAGLAQYREEAAGFDLLMAEFQSVLAKIQQ